MAIKEARRSDDYAAARSLFGEYAAQLGVDLSFQNFADELANLPGDYALPHGCLLIAWRGAEAVGCVAFRSLEPGICEMKRLYVKPDARGLGLGRSLALAIIAEARSRGYARIRLDTLPAMTEARAMYRTLGFHEIPSYRFNPVPGTAFMELDLTGQ